MNLGKPKLGAIARLLLGLTLPDSESRFLIGDYEEEYNCIYREKGLLRAKLWLWILIIESLPGFIYNSFYGSAIMFNNYLKIAFRNLKKHKGYSFINIFGLAISLSCAIVLIIWIQDELGYDTFHKNAENIYQVYTEFGYGDDATQVFGGSYYPLAKTLKDECPGVEKAARYREYRNMLVEYGEKSFTEEQIIVADQEFLEIFTFPIVTGDAATALEAPNSVVLTESTSRKYFGSEDPIGKSLRINKEYDVTVTGIIRDVPRNSSTRFSMISPFTLTHSPAESYTHWGGNPLSTFIQLGKNTGAVETEKKITEIVDNHDPLEPSQKRSFKLQPLTNLHLYDLGGGGLIFYIYIFSIVAAFILLIACINYMNLATARSSNRAREVGLRKAVGASRKEIMKQFYGESFILTFTAFLISIVLTALFIPAFNNLSGKELSFALSTQFDIILAVLLLALFTGLLSGSYPALYLSSFQPSEVLKSKISTGSKNPVLRKILVITQFSLSIFLIVCTIIISRQTDFMISKDLGYDKNGIMIVSLNDELKEKYASFKQELLKDPGIYNVSTSLQFPLSIYSSTTADWEGKETEEEVLFNWDFVSFDYIKTLGIEIVEGRDFSEEFSSDPEEACIINETAARSLGIGSPVGKWIKPWFGELRIVGVVKDYHFKTFHNEIDPLILKIRPSWSNLAFISTSPDNFAAATTYIEKVCKEFAPDFSFNYYFFNNVIERYYAEEIRMKKILNIFSFLAILIACLGLLGLASFTVDQRTKEIGIRKVLGAGNGNIIYILTKELIKLVIAANIIALPAAFFASNKWLENFFYRIDLSWTPFLLSTLLAVLIAVFTVCTQSIKAARANPVKSLRYE